MKRGEQKFWRDQLQLPFKAIGDADRIESTGTALGRPDVNLVIPMGIVWDIELKYCDDGKVKMRPSQRGWFSRRKRFGHPCFVFTKVVTNSGVFYMINMNGHIPDGDVLNDWIADAHVVWDDNIDWVQFEEVLREKERR